MGFAVLALVLALRVTGAGTTPAAATPAPQAPPSKIESKPSPAPGLTPIPTRTVVGEIIAVDHAGETIVVKEALQGDAPGRASKAQEPVALKLDANTQIVRGKEPVSAKTLRQKDHVVVRYALTESGPRALTIRVALLATPTPSPGAPASP